MGRQMFYSNVFCVSLIIRRPIEEMKVLRPKADEESKKCIRLIELFVCSIFSLNNILITFSRLASHLRPWLIECALPHVRMNSYNFNSLFHVNLQLN